MSKRPRSPSEEMFTFTDERARAAKRPRAIEPRKAPAVEPQKEKHGLAHVLRENPGTNIETFITKRGESYFRCNDCGVALESTKNTKFLKSHILSAKHQMNVKTPNIEGIVNGELQAKEQRVEAYTAKLRSNKRNIPEHRPDKEDDSEEEESVEGGSDESEDSKGHLWRSNGSLFLCGACANLPKWNSSEPLVTRPGVNSRLKNASLGVYDSELNSISQFTPNELLRLHNELLSEFPGSLLQTGFARNGALMVTCMDCIWGPQPVQNFRDHAGRITHLDNMAKRVKPKQIIPEKAFQGVETTNVKQDHAPKAALPLIVEEQASEASSYVQSIRTRLQNILPQLGHTGTPVDILSRAQIQPQQNEPNSRHLPLETNRVPIFGDMSRGSMELVIRAKNDKIRELEDKIRLLEKEAQKSRKINAEFMDAVTEWTRKGALRGREKD